MLVVNDSAVVVAVPHQNTFVDGLTQEVLVSHRVPMAVAAANDTHLAVEGVDRISLFGSGDDHFTVIKASCPDSRMLVHM